MPLTPKEAGGTGAPKVFPHDIPYSALFDGVGDHLSFAPSVAGNSGAWTVRTCLKRAKSSDSQILAVRVDTNNRMGFSLNGAGNIQFYDRQSGVNNINLLTAEVFVDQTAHYDIVLSVDTTEATASERVKLYVNGLRITSFTSETYPVLDYSTLFLTTNEHRLGQDNGIHFFGGYLSDFYIIDGQALPASTYGEFSDQVTGLWVPKNPGSLTYGTNGCCLDLGNAVDLGADVSGNGNHWTVNGSPVQTMDTPTNNACVLNALDPNAGALSNGNLTLASGSAKPTLQPERGQWSYRKGGVEQLYDADVSGKFEPDLTADTYEFTGYTPTAGYKLITATNYQNPAVMKSASAAAVVLAAGSASAINIDFPDMEGGADWVNAKRRDAATNWGMVDAERGDELTIYTDLASGQNTETGGISLTHTGFSFGPNTSWNQAGADILALALKAGVNQGFEIVPYSGASSAQDIAHNLGKAPTFMLVKRLDVASNWAVYHKDIPLGGGYRFWLNLTAAVDRGGTPHWTEAPTATHFSVGTNSENNASGGSYVAYLVTDSDIFKAFSYTGNGSADGPFVNLDGRALSVPFSKDTASGTASWLNWDALRDPFNPQERVLFPNLSNAESTTANMITNTSTGFKLGTLNAGYNSSGNLHVGLAILESTSKYANAY